MHIEASLNKSTNIGMKKGHLNSSEVSIKNIFCPMHHIWLTFIKKIISMVILVILEIKKYSYLFIKIQLIKLAHLKTVLMSVQIIDIEK